MVGKVGYVTNHQCQSSLQNIVVGEDLQRLNEVSIVYNTSEIMAVYDEYPPSNKEDSAQSESEPPGFKGSRESLQPNGATRLSNRSMRSRNIRGWELVFICHSVGAKPYLGYHNSTSLSEDDEVNH